MIKKMESIYFYNKVITHFTGIETNKQRIILQARSTYKYKIFNSLPNKPLGRFTIFRYIFIFRLRKMKDKTIIHEIMEQRLV